MERAPSQKSKAATEQQSDRDRCDTLCRKNGVLPLVVWLHYSDVEILRTGA